VAAVERSLGKESRLPLTRLPPNPFVTHNCETAHARLLSCHLVLLSPLRPSILIIALRCCIFPSPLPPWRTSFRIDNSPSTQPRAIWPLPRRTTTTTTMNVTKKFDRLKQWTNEKMGAEARTGLSDDFKALEMEMNLRHEGMHMRPSAAPPPGQLAC
jgi:hypothetical protein